MKLKFDREPDLPDGLRWLFEGVADLYPLLEVLLQRTERLLSDQDTLNAYVARIGDAVTAIHQEITDLKAAVDAGVPAQQLDFSGLDAAVASVEAEEAPAAPAPAPAPAPEPVPAPAAPDVPATPADVPTPPAS